MKTFVFTGPDGKEYEVSGPDNGTQEQAFAILQQQHGQQAMVRSGLAPDRTPIAQLPESPMTGMSGPQKFLAGAGKTFSGLARGVQQAMLAPYEGGAVSRRQAELSSQEAEARQLDAPLSADPLGKAGEITGMAAAAAPTVFIPGANTYTGSALIGAGVGAIQPTVEPGERLTNMAVGGGAGLASQAAGRLIASALQGGKALVEPLTKGGQEKIAGRTIRSFAGGPVKPTPAATPGWQPTAAEATQNPGLAVLQRGAEAANPETARLLAERQFGQNAAAMNALEQISGTPADRSMAEGVRSYMGGLYDTATSKAIDPAVAASVRPQIDSLMARPAMKQAAARAAEIFDESQIAQTKAGSVQGLQYLKQALDDMIERAGSPGSSIGQNQLRALQQTRSDLIKTMEQIAPDLRAADAIYAGLSRPINEMEAGKALTEKLRPALMDYAPGAPTRLNAQQYAAAMRNLEEVLPKMTGYPGSTVENTFTPQNQQLMTGVAQDLAKRAAVTDMARGPGSNTAQNLATRNVMRQALGPLGLPEKWSETALLQTLMKPLNLVYGGIGENAAQRALAEALLDPQLAAQLSMAQPAARQLPTQVLSRLPAVTVPLALELQR